MEPTLSGVGVIDKAVSVLTALREGPATLAELVVRTDLPRATTHRLARALEVHGLVRRTADGRFALGTALVGLGRAAARSVPVAEAAGPALAWLRDETGESVQLFVPEGGRRVCLVALDSPHGLRAIVPAGAVLPLGVGSAGRILAPGWEPGPTGWEASVGEREAGVASVSSPVHDATGAIVAAVSVSGPLERTGPDPGPRFGLAVVEAARRIEGAPGSTGVA